MARCKALGVHTSMVHVMENQTQTKREVLTKHGQAIDELVEQKWGSQLTDEEYIQAVHAQRAETLSKLELLKEP
jgi:hypothetical protein